MADYYERKQVFRARLMMMIVTIIIKQFGRRRRLAFDVL